MDKLLVHDSQEADELVMALKTLLSDPKGEHAFPDKFRKIGDLQYFLNNPEYYVVPANRSPEAINKAKLQQEKFQKIVINRINKRIADLSTEQSKKEYIKHCLEQEDLTQLLQFLENLSPEQIRRLLQI